MLAELGYILLASGLAFCYVRSVGPFTKSRAAVRRKMTSYMLLDRECRRSYLNGLCKKRSTT